MTVICDTPPTTLVRFCEFCGGKLHAGATSPCFQCKRTPEDRAPTPGAVYDVYTGSPSPPVITRKRLASELRRIGIKSSDIVCLHVGMKLLGHVIGAQRTIIEAMMDSASTLMMATYSGDISDPSAWRHPSVPETMVDEIRDAIPAYNKSLTPSRGVGSVAEYFRTLPRVQRSSHPQSSFAALGEHALDLVGNHPLENRFGPESPLGALEAMRGRVLMIGAPRDTASIFHLVTFLVGGVPKIRKSTLIGNGGNGRCWVDYDDINYPSHWFEQGVAKLIEAGIATVDRIGNAETILFPAAEAVKFLVEWRASVLSADMTRWQTRRLTP